MAISTVNQVKALCKRYLITQYRSPISSLIRILVWPGLILGLCIYILSSIPLNDFTKEQHYETYVGPVVFFLTGFHVYHFVQWLVTDRSTSMKSIMISMGLKRSSYNIANSLCIAACIAPPVLIIAIASINYLYNETQSTTWAVLSIFILFIVHLIGFIFVVTSFITSSSFVPVIVVILLLEGGIHAAIIWLMPQASYDVQQLILFIGSASPYESLRIFSSSYTLCNNCDQTRYDGKKFLVSQPTYLIILAMVFWSSVSFAFARWFEEICPWQKDSAVKKPFFCCMPDPRQDLFDAPVDMTLPESKYFEKPRTDRQVGISIRNLSKKYRGLPVVDNLTFNVYKGETTLLLGHNGAGKTTLMNMILGKLSPDGGNVAIRHQNLHVDGFGGIGVCPQTSVLDENLNVWQHLELFLNLKSSVIPSEQQWTHIKTTINDVSLSNHMYKLPSELSGGMKRKLSLAMAFVGDSKILILDEPSSGLDPDSRVFIWNAIRRYRGDRAVLLSTQHMEEADYLGDRIAIMSSGKIICCGSSIFLNDIFGTGYKLRVEYNTSMKKQVLKFIRKHFENAKPNESESAPAPVKPNKQDPVVDMIVELTDRKVEDSESKMIRMLEELESKSKELHIHSHGLKSSSLEDVLLNTNKYFNTDHESATRLTLTSASGHIATLASPLRLPSSSYLATQRLFLYAFFMKHLQTYRQDWKSISIYRVLIPAVTMWNRVYGMNSLYISFSQQIMLTYRPDYMCAVIICHFIYYPTLEKTSKFKTMQLTSQASFVVYWLSQLAIDFFTTIVAVFTMNLFLVTTFNGDFLVSQATVHLISTLGVILFCTSASLLAYILSNLITNPSNAIGYHIIIYLIQPIMNTVVVLLGLAITKDLGWLQSFLNNLFVAISPVNAFEYIIYGYGSKCYLNNLSMACTEIAGVSPVVIGLIALSAQLLVYGFLLYLVERENIDLTRYIDYRNLISFFKPKPRYGSEEIEVDQDVVDETTKARTLINNAPRDVQSLVAADLSKSYIRGQPVVKNLSFTVNRGECFGLLGVNGAGKSTTFSMIAAESRPDSGQIWLNGHYSTGDIDYYRHKLGYDPQTNPELSLSPYNALYLMARLRRVNEQSIAMLINSVLELLDMDEHTWKCSRDLSGGTKRKLALGMALIGTPSLLALDEPTAGVDPIARRSVWQLLRSLRIQNAASILISSHAMEECEAICDRISIMARGRLRCIGTFLHLRSKFARGCSIRIQFSSSIANSASASSSPQQQRRRHQRDGESSPSDDNKGKQINVRQVISDLQNRLVAVVGLSVSLADTNVNSATFNISDNSVKRSVLFKVLREFKKQHQELSYVINDSSLEDIFISLAREQQELEENSG